MCSLLFSYSQNQIRNLQNLVGESARYADDDMRKKGYTHIKTEKSGWDSYAYYWNSNNRKCAIVRTNNGDIASIVDTPSSDCNQYDNRDNYYQVNHSSRHHSNGQHYSDSKTDMAYERGYNDGLHNKSYHNPYGANAIIKAYAQGYQVGVEQRQHNTSYHSTRGGYHSHVTVTDLEGSGATLDYDELKSRGFTQQKEHSHDGKTYRVWYNSQTQQCIKTTSINKRIALIQVSTHCN